MTRLPVNSFSANWKRASAVLYKQMWQAMNCSRQTPPYCSQTFLTFWIVFERVTKTCSDKVYSLTLLSCSNFQSSAMFEGSECVEVDGGSTESTVASSISACKKVKTKTELPVVFVLGWECTSTCISLFVCCICFISFAFFSVHVRLSIISVRPLICWCVFPAVQEIFISSEVGVWSPGVV